MSEKGVRVGKLGDVSGEEFIAAADSHNGSSTGQIPNLFAQTDSPIKAKSIDGRFPYQGLDVFKSVNLKRKLP